MTTPVVPEPLTKAEALHYLLGIHCPSCSAVLSGPGLPCDACGKIPPVTGPQAEEMLDSATAIAAVQEKVLEAEAEALYQAAIEKWEQAAQVVHLARLQDQRDAAQKAFDEHERAHKQKVAAFDAAEAAEDAAAAELAPQAAAVAELAAAVEMARVMKHGAVAVAQAKTLHDNAVPELEPYQKDLTDAAAVRQAAEDAVTRSGARGDQLKQALEDAKADLASPGIAPVGHKAILAGPLRLLQDGKVGDAGMEIAADVGRDICDRTGVTDEIAAEARGQLLAEQQSAARNQPLIRQSDPPGPDARPNPYPPAIAPGWG